MSGSPSPTDPIQRCRGSAADGATDRGPAAQFLAPEETIGRGPRFRQHIPELAPGCWTLNTS